MGEHVDHRDKRKRALAEHPEARRRRATFKQYLQDIEEELLEAELLPDDEGPAPDDVAG